MENRKSIIAELSEGAAIGFIAGGLANLAVGFKEGPVGGLIGGVIDKSISYGMQTRGYSKAASEISAFAITALLDVGGLHYFGMNANAPVPYLSEEDMGMHHLVFYSALMLGMAGVSVYKNGFGFFNSASVNANNSEQTQQFKKTM